MILKTPTFGVFHLKEHHQLPLAAALRQVRSVDPEPYRRPQALEVRQAGRKDLNRPLEGRLFSAREPPLKRNIRECGIEGLCLGRQLKSSGEAQ
jgi:hypothetical protein